jgi:hypothetical protein
MSVGVNIWNLSTIDISQKSNKRIMLQFYNNFFFILFIIFISFNFSHSLNIIININIKIVFTCWVLMSVCLCVCVCVCVCVWDEIDFLCYQRFIRFFFIVISKDYHHQHRRHHHHYSIIKLKAKSSVSIIIMYLKEKISPRRLTKNSWFYFTFHLHFYF